MRHKITLALAAFAASSALAAPAFAEDLGGGFSVNGGAALVSDYRFRGISQTDKRAAVQGNITVSHASGFYATVWGSSIDDYVAMGSDQEIDLVGGYRRTVGGTTFDVGVLYYYYPGSGGHNTDFIEPYASVSHIVGPLTAKVSAAYAPKQKAIGLQVSPTEFEEQDNLYLAGDLTAGIPNTPISVTGHVGHSFGPSYLTIGDEYTDWSIGASYTYKVLTLGVSYVDTDADAFSPSGRNISKGGIVGSAAVAF